MSLTRSGAMGSVEVLTGNIEFFTLFTTLNITVTGNYTDDSQKDFESVVQCIGLRAMPTVMNNPELLHLLNRMRQMDAIRRDQFVQRRYQALLAIANESRM